MTIKRVLTNRQIPHLLLGLLATAALLSSLLLFQQASAADPSYVRLKNRWNNTYLYESSSQVAYGFPAETDPSSHWELVDTGSGSVRIKNRVSGHYMSIEGLPTYVRVTPIYSAWDSAKWSVADAPASGYKTIQNAWSTSYLNIEDLGGYAKSSYLPATNESVQWVIESAPAITLEPSYVLIKSRASGDYLFAGDGKVMAGSLSSMDAAWHWLVEDNGFTKRIKNRSTGHYMSVEPPAEDWVKSMEICTCWESAQWRLWPDASGAYRAIQNVWSGVYIHVAGDKAYAEYGYVSDAVTTTQWILEAAPDLPEATATSTPSATPTPFKHYLSLINVEQVLPSATATSTPTGTATAVTGTPTSTSTATASPTVDPDGFYVRIKSVSNLSPGRYLYESEEKVLYGNPPASDLTSQWILKEVGNSYVIKNRATGHAMAIEHELAYVESIVYYDSWASSKWTISDASTPGASIIRNVWHAWQILHVDGQQGYAEYGDIATTRQSAQWMLEPVFPDAPPTNTRTAMPTTTPAAATPTPGQPERARGASVPWVEYEAEQGSTNGVVLGPSRIFGSYSAESSGRRSVRLNNTGDYVQFTTSAPANSIVLRYAIPDAPSGNGITATLSLYVDNVFTRSLTLTSRYAWSYGGETGTLNDPGAGGAHHFFDETRALLGDIPAGATVKLQKDAGDTADHYVIDLVDLEQVAPPLTMPISGYLSLVADCGATPDDGLDDGPTLNGCISQAKAASKGVWIPAGTFESTSTPISVADVTIRGAGMWHTTIHGLYARFNCTGNNCRYYDFSVLGETITRNDAIPDNGFNGGAGLGSRMEHIWVEHTKVGWWVGAGPNNVTNGLLITGSRFRNLFADGVNLVNGTSYSVVENNHFRNTGDDSLAAWSPSFDGGVNTGNTFRFNTVQLPWRANCYAIYGGRDNTIENNVCADTITYPGIMLAQQYTSWPFAGTTTVQRNDLIRAGGPMFSQGHGALKLLAWDAALNGTVIIKDILIDSPSFAGIEFQGPYAINNASFDTITILNPPTWGIHVTATARGAATLANVIVSSPGISGLGNENPENFTITRGNGNSGW